MISKWILKAIVQKTISYLPNKDKINYWFQKNITKGVELNDLYFEYKIIAASDHIRFFKKYSNSYENSNVLELGTGWYPIVPIAMYLSGFSTIYSIDLTNWTSNEKLITTIRKYKEWYDTGKLQDYLINIDSVRWISLMSLLEKKISMDELCERINLIRIIGDARKTEFENNSIDFICSNNTFEHIPRIILEDILKEQNRISNDQAVISHFIDMSDHFAHMDSSINIYNFLKFSSRQWKFIDNSIQPQNRMRFRDYIELLGKTNYSICKTEFRPGDLNKLKKVNISGEFENYTLEELAISHGYVVSKIV